MPWNRPTLAQLVDRIETDFASRLLDGSGLLKRSVLGVLAYVWAGACHALHGFQSWMSGQPMADTAEAEYLARLAAIWGVARKPAAFASGPVAFTGTDGAVIPAGSELQTADGVLYALDEDATIVVGAASGQVTALAAGAAGNLTEGEPLSLVSPVSGVQSSVAAGAGGLTNGADEEQDADLRIRLLARIQQPPHGGAAHDYEAWAKEVEGVTRVWVYPLRQGLGTVGLTFVLDNEETIIPDAAKVAEVQAYIDARRPVTAAVTVFAPVAQPIDFTIAITPDTEAVRQAVTLELEDFLARVAEPETTVLLSQSNEAISIAAGETDHVLSSPTENVSVASGKFPTMGTITWSA